MPLVRVVELSDQVVSEILQVLITISKNTSAANAAAVAAANAVV